MTNKKTTGSTDRRSKKYIIANELIGLINDISLSIDIASSRGVDLNALCNISDDGLINALFRYFDIPVNEDECIWCHDIFYDFIFNHDIDGFLNKVVEYHLEAKGK